MIEWINQEKKSFDLFDLLLSKILSVILKISVSHIKHSISFILLI